MSTSLNKLAEGRIEIVRSEVHFDGLCMGTIDHEGYFTHSPLWKALSHFEAQLIATWLWKNHGINDSIRLR